MKRRIDLDAPEILDAYRQGENAKAIALRLHAPPTTILRRINAAGLRRKYIKRRRVQIDTEQLVKQYREGASLHKLAQMYSTTPQTISRRLDEAGMARRPQRRPRKDSARLAADLFQVYADANMPLKIKTLARWAQVSDMSVYRRIKEMTQEVKSSHA